MDRRCTTSSCLTMAGARTFRVDLPVASILPNPRSDWMKIAGVNGRIRVARDLEVDWKEFCADNYLFTHATIVASVATEDNGYHIKPACSDLVNNNGNGWTNEVLLSTFRSFIGAENYLEHVQVPELSKGKILDAVLRPITYANSEGETADIYYCDILVATNRKHEKLVTDIQSGDLNTMSMGCLADKVQCSCCGVILGDTDPNCEHIDRMLRQSFTDENGVERIIAELCGCSVEQEGKRVGDEKSCRFIEASWVRNPAFYGAILNHFISEIPQTAQIIKFPTEALEDTMENIFKLRVADRAGMIALNVARAELMRRKQMAIADRIVRSVV